MFVLRHARLCVVAIGCIVCLDARSAHAADPLPAWKQTATKQAILAFVEKVTTAGSPDYVAPEDRIATFDNDGTLWVEQPMYTQLAFALDRVRMLAPEHPEWSTTQPFQAVLENDLAALAASGQQGLVELVMATHAGISTDDFTQIVTDWFATARHPRFDRPYPELTYRPMVELLEYLRANEFETYIVSGGGVDFMRVMTQAVYGIPPQQVIGSTIETKFQLHQGQPVLMRQASVDFVDDQSGKPVGIHKFIGKRPIIAVGNSAGDREMLEWTAAGSGPRLMMLVLHDDATREYAYGPANGLPDSHFGAFPQSLMDEASSKGWEIVSMRNDWVLVFASDQ